jgi:aminoglycoside phosphotransferase (APT) family kinase protein
MPDLPPPRTWCGGSQWPNLVQQDLAPLLNTDAQRSASDRVTQLLDVEDVSAGVLCHGDFGPHNILWDQDHPASLIDLDHACVGDPAIDLAPLIGFHGLQAIRPIAPPSTLQRAMIHRATLSLQVAAAAHINRSFDLRDHALRNFANRTAQGTLFEPTGMTPTDI